MYARWFQLELDVTVTDAFHSFLSAWQCQGKSMKAELVEVKTRSE
jgi:hypothetical protein